MREHEHARPVELLWAALEDRPRLRGVRQEIKDRLGPDYDFAVPFLMPSGKKASRYPCQFPSGSGCPRRIINDADGSIRAVCGCTPKECDTVLLSQDDDAILRFDDSPFARTLQQQLGVTGEYRSEANGDLITLGTIRPAGATRIPVVLIMATSCQDAEALIARIQRKYRQGAVALTLTDQYIDPETEGRLMEPGFTWLVLADLLFADSKGLTAKCKLVDVLMEKTGPTPNPTTVTRTEERVFRNGGQIWTLTFDGKTVHMRPVKGLVHICHLLRTSQPIPAAALMAPGAGPAAGTIPMGSAGDVLTPETITKYRRRVRELESEIDEAGRNNDLGRKEALEDEREQIEVQLRSAVGLGGRLRTASDDSENARKAVFIAITRAITAIRKHHGPLADHLQRYIDRGHQLSYTGDGIPWNF